MDVHPHGAEAMHRSVASKSDMYPSLCISICSHVVSLALCALLHVGFCRPTHQSWIHHCISAYMMCFTNLHA